MNLLRKIFCFFFGHDWTERKWESVQVEDFLYHEFYYRRCLYCGKRED
jgi:hypothetical protein